MANCYLNDRICDLHEASVSVLDRGFLFGDGVYEVVPVYARMPFYWQAHMARLAQSLTAIDLEFDLARLAAPRDSLIAQCEQAEQSLYLQITRGVVYPRKHPPPDKNKTTPTLFMVAQPRAAPLPELHARGIACITQADFRWLRGFIKSTSLLPAVLLANEAKKAAVEETILIRDGIVTEGFSSNVMLVHGQVVSTPVADARILKGVTYEVVLQCAEQAGFEVVRREIGEAELWTADEIWISSSTREMLPVTRLDDKPIGGGKPPATQTAFQKVYAEFKKHVELTCKESPADE